MSGDWKKRLGAALLGALFFPGSLLAQEKPTVQKISSAEDKPDSVAAVASQRPILIDVDLVLVYVSVIDPYNRFVTGLGKEHFRIMEDQQEQNISHFSS